MLSKSQKVCTATIAILCAISFQTYIDLYLPSCPKILTFFDTSSEMIQKSLSLYLLGASIFFVPFGILSDVFGRKKLFITGLAILVIGNLISVLSPNVYIFLLSRFIQGIGATIYVLTPSVLIDIFEEKELLTSFTCYNIAYSFIPLIAPYIGGIIILYFSWKSNFIVLGVVAIIILIFAIFLMKESLHEEKRIKSNLRQISKNLRAILSHRKYLIFTLLPAISWSSVIAFFTAAPFLYQQTYHISPYYYGVISLLIGGVYLISTLFNNFLTKWILPIRLIKISIIASFIFSLISLIIVYNTHGSLLSITFFTIGTVFLIGLLFINAMTISLRDFKEGSGLASSMQATMWVLIWSIVTWVISHFNYSEKTIIITYFTMSCINLVIFIFIMKGLRKLDKELIITINRIPIFRRIIR